MLNRWIFIFILTAFQSLAHADESLAEGRFKAAIKKVKQSIELALKENPDFDEMSKADQAAVFLKSGLRASAFKLQALGRLYQQIDHKELREFAMSLRDSTKELEDLLGEFDLRQTVGNKTEVEQAARAFLKSMTNGRWIAENSPGEIFEEWRDSIKAIDWPTDQEDRKFVITEIAEQVNRLRKTEYDMGFLEQGMHELRRELRWFSLYVISTDGQIQKSNNGQFACPIKEQAFLEFADPKYSQLKSDPQFPQVCRISACVYDEIVGAVGAFGDLKDQAEKILDKDPDLQKKDRTPKKIRQQAEKHYEQLVHSEVLDMARAQLRACLK